MTDQYLTSEPHTFNSSSVNRYYGQGPSRQTWSVAEVDSKAVEQSEAPSVSLWRLAASGSNVEFRLTWGRSNNLLTGIRAPLVAYIPQAFMLEASKIDSQQPASALSTLTYAAGASLSLIRTFQAAAGALPSTSARVTALTAATVTVQGNAVALAAGASLDVAQVAVLTAGVVMIEHAI